MRREYVAYGNYIYHMELPIGDYPCMRREYNIPDGIEDELPGLPLHAQGIQVYFVA